ncbi:alphaK I12 [Puccinia graminis f. sp. tritici CRL 75-36-700-3]|uniref:AlphaK I12 n=1 Tax=Puccinia graminis f. sp. tritici (strain CRL 75-36-700-3 / race SCCL) TaxID=418459 RepID=E3KHY4_PUCGT|nr:alphaK I12 [Puccinia graminis f. sp. tritici CRL 75-36-700-3]EFP83909.1 alphaK I12 [Puccinia graminis f. sp. tritici CRL 75-36-700-3]
MRRAFEATVRTIASDGSVKLVNYVAKIRFRDGAPNISHYASDALMYEGSALLLDEFKKILPGCQRLREVYLKKGQLMEIVRHAVVVCGEINLPSEVYFLEVALVGPYVKYSSNVNFRIKENWEGVDPDIARLMNAFMHWSYVNSNGKSLICDLQGVGPMESPFRHWSLLSLAQVVIFLIYVTLNGETTYYLSPRLNLVVVTPP